jgi:hypothetical protein
MWGVIFHVFTCSKHEYVPKNKKLAFVKHFVMSRTTVSANLVSSARLKVNRTTVSENLREEDLMRPGLT